MRGCFGVGKIGGWISVRRLFGGLSELELVIWKERMIGKVLGVRVKIEFGD